MFQGSMSQGLQESYAVIKVPRVDWEGWNELEADIGVIGSDAEVNWDDTASDDED